MWGLWRYLSLSGLRADTYLLHPFACFFLVIPHCISSYRCQMPLMKLLGHRGFHLLRRWQTPKKCWRFTFPVEFLSACMDRMDRMDWGWWVWALKTAQCTVHRFRRTAGSDVEWCLESGRIRNHDFIRSHSEVIPRETMRNPKIGAPQIIPKSSQIIPNHRIFHGIFHKHPAESSYLAPCSFGGLLTPCIDGFDGSGPQDVRMSGCHPGGFYPMDLVSWIPMNTSWYIMIHHDNS
jgi:hypothetical protein